MTVRLMPRGYTFALGSGVHAKKGGASGARGKNAPPNNRWPPSEDDAVCTVCMAGFDDDGERVTLPCGHGFHGKCIVPWLWQTRSCPNCRERPEGEPDEGEIPYVPLAELLRTMRDQSRRNREQLTRALRHARRADAPPALTRARALRAKWRAARCEASREIATLERRLVDERRKMREEYALLREHWRDASNRIHGEFKTRTRPINQELARLRRRRRAAETHAETYEQRMVDALP